MAIEAAALRRRTLLLAGLAGMAACGATGPARAAPLPDHLAAAWADAAGRHGLGLLQASAGTVRVLDTLELPTRAHGLACAADGSIFAVARRPGDWLLRWWPATTGAARLAWCWAEAEQRFNGHLLLSADGRWLFSTEIDLDSGQGLLVRRDPSTLQASGRWPTGGLDPHDMEWLPDGQLLVANGGITTLPETGRVKHALQRMDSSLVRIDPASGQPTGRWRLPDARLSLRHLARHPSGLVGVALQAEHDDPAERAAAPVLALFDPGAQTLEAATAMRLDSGYAGDIAALPEGWLLSGPREHRAQRLSLRGAPQSMLRLESACALVADAAAPGAWLLGRDSLQRDDAGPAGAAVPALPPGGRFDNHAVRWHGVPG